ncbi:LOW QUALITY PROTEIN: fibroin heavy chain-like [Xenia sp. Carnegie-2017]|uniref:LOW QUALITY PROTEIN: fibroin heavy chain-like n=1 Tax=Xenia sp. Carnegie-2017 TaxID=2897299 RepID=UPI001F04371E|nr:LOW QUALITY PROTEIN: fibroin heavy chain-like [Xenia sp. Carnegie-2017]
MQRFFVALVLCLAVMTLVRGAALNRERRSFDEDIEDRATVTRTTKKTTDESEVRTIWPTKNESRSSDSNDQSTSSENPPNTQESGKDTTTNKKGESTNNEDKSNTHEESNEDVADTKDAKNTPSESSAAFEKDNLETSDKLTIKNKKKTKKRWFGWNPSFSYPGFAHGFPLGFGVYGPGLGLGPAGLANTWNYGLYPYGYGGLLYRHKVPKGKKGTKRNFLFGAYPGYGRLTRGALPFGNTPWKSGLGAEISERFYRNKVQIPDSSKKWYIPVGVGYGNAFGVAFPDKPMSNPSQGLDLGSSYQDNMMSLSDQQIGNSPLKRDDINKRFLGQGLGCNGLGCQYPGPLGVGLGYGMGPCWHGSCGSPFGPLSLGNLPGMLNCGGCTWAYKNNIDKNGKMKRDLDFVCKKDKNGNKAKRCLSAWPVFGGWGGYSGFGGIGGWGYGLHPGYGLLADGLYGSGYGLGLGCGGCGFAYKSKIGKDGKAKRELVYACDKNKAKCKRFFGGLNGYGLGYPLGWGGLGFGGYGLGLGGYGLGGLGGLYGPGYSGLYGSGYGLGLGCGGCGFAYKSKIGKDGKEKRELVYACDKNKAKSKRCFGSLNGYGLGYPLGWGGLGFGGYGLGLGGYGLGGLGGLYGPGYSGLYGSGYGLGLGCGGCGFAYKSKIGKDGKAKRELVYACDKNKAKSKRCFGSLNGYGLGYPFGWGGLGFGGYGLGLGGYGLGGLGGLYGPGYSGLYGLGYGLGLGCGGCGFAYKSKIGKDGKAKRELVHACDKNKAKCKRFFGGLNGYGLGYPLGWGGLGFGGYGLGLGGYGLGGLGGLYGPGYSGLYGSGYGLGLGCGGCGFAYKSKIGKDGKAKRELVYGCDKNKAKCKRFFGGLNGIGIGYPLGWGGLGYGGYGLGFGGAVRRLGGLYGPGYSGLYGSGYGLGLGCGGCGFAYKSKIGKDGKEKRELVHACDKNKAKCKRFFGSLNGIGIGYPLGWGGLGFGGYGLGFGGYGLGGLGGLYGPGYSGLYGSGYGLGLGCGGCGFAYKSKIGKDGKEKRELVHACDKNKAKCKRFFGSLNGIGIGYPLGWGGLGYGGYGLGLGGYGLGLGGYGLGGLGGLYGSGYGLGLGCGGCGFAYKSKIGKDGKEKRELVYACDKNKAKCKRFFGSLNGIGIGYPLGWGGLIWRVQLGLGGYGLGLGGYGLGGLGGLYGSGYGLGLGCGGCGFAYKSKIGKDGKEKRELVHACDKNKAKSKRCFGSLNGYGLGYPLGWGGLGFGGYGLGLGGLGGLYGPGYSGLYGSGYGLGLGCGGCGFAYKSKIGKDGKAKRELVYACDKNKAKSKRCFGSLNGYGLGYPLGWGGLGFGGYGLGLGGYGLGGLGGLYGPGYGFGLGFGGCGTFYRSKVDKNGKTSRRHLCDSPIAHAPFASLRNRFNAGFGPYARAPWWGGYALGVYPGLGPYSFGVVSKSKIGKSKTLKKCGIAGCMGGLGLGLDSYQGPSTVGLGSPGSGFGTYPTRFPWMKTFPSVRSAVSSSKKGQKRGYIPSKKQTIHLGYGYASGDNYRLGYGLGGMGALDPLQSHNGIAPVVPNVPHVPHVFGRSKVPRQMIGLPSHDTGDIGTPFGYSANPGQVGHPVLHPGYSTMAYPGHAIATADVKKGKVPADSTSKRQVLVRPGHTGLALGHGPIGPVAGPGSFPTHLITHPGFSTLGFPGHAMASLDIKHKIPEKKSRSKRQAILASPVGRLMAGFPGMVTHPSLVPNFASSSIASAPVAMRSPLMYLTSPSVARRSMSVGSQLMPSQSLTNPFQRLTPGLAPAMEAPIFPMGK